MAVKPDGMDVPLLLQGRYEAEEVGTQKFPHQEEANNDQLMYDEVGCKRFVQILF